MISVANGFTGLCSTCDNAPACTFPRQANRPVRQCEEFSGGKGQRQRSALEGTAVSSAGFTPKEENPGPGVGLCRNCEERESCAFPKPDGGIWRCEEYR